MAVEEDVTLGVAIVEVNLIAVVGKDSHHFFSTVDGHGAYLLSFRMIIVYNKKKQKSNLELSVKQIDFLFNGT